MSTQVRLVRADQSIGEAAKTMRDIDAGCLPVERGDRLVGMITDRDIAIRAVAQGKGPDTRVCEVMTDEVRYCFEDEDVEDVALNMSELQIRRLPVLNRDKRLIGFISLSDIAQAGRDAQAGQALASIAKPGGVRTDA
jgi:CBS domain-containing protein